MELGWLGKLVGVFLLVAVFMTDIYLLVFFCFTAQGWIQQAVIDIKFWTETVGKALWKQWTNNDFLKYDWVKINKTYMAEDDMGERKEWEILQADSLI